MVKFNVTQGIVHVNNIYVLQSTLEVIHFYIDFKQKYPCLTDSSNCDFYFGASERTLNVKNKHLDHTCVKVLGLPRKWYTAEASRIITLHNVRAMVEMGKYSASVMLVKDEKNYHAKFAKSHWFDDT